MTEIISLVENILTKLRIMSEKNRGIQMPIASMLALTDIIDGAYDKDYIICINGGRSDSWIEVIPASMEIGGRFKDKETLDRCLNFFLDGTTVLGWFCEAVGEAVLYTPDLKSDNDCYHISLIRK